MSENALWQTLAALVIVGSAVVWWGRRLWNSLRPSMMAASSCGSCGGCELATKSPPGGIPATPGFVPLSVLETTEFQSRSNDGTA